MAVMSDRTGDDRKCLVVTRIPEGYARPWADGEVDDILFRDIKRNGHGEERAIGKAEIVYDTVRKFSVAVQVANRGICNSLSVVGLVHEALEGAEATIENKLEVTQLTLMAHEDK